MRPGDQKLPKSMKRYENRVRDFFREYGNFEYNRYDYWINLNPGWRSMEDPLYPIHSIHCQTKGECYDELKECVPCDCEECRSALERMSE